MHLRRPRRRLPAIGLTAAVAMAMAVMLSSAALVLGAAPAAADAAHDAETTFLRLVNQERQVRGLPLLIGDGGVANTSRSWSATMASTVGLAHDPNLAEAVGSVESNWTKIGENVGYGDNAVQLHNAFMNSSGHRANVLDPGFNRVGIGVVFGGGRLWVTFRFLAGPPIAGPTGLEAPPPPPPLSRAASLTGDFDGDGRGDLLSYGPGGAADGLWFGTANRRFRYVATSVNGHYRPVAGDFNGDGRDEVLWYAPGTAADFAWSWTGSGWSSMPLSISGTYEPVAGDFDGDGVDDIFWYAPGPAADFMWWGSSGGFRSTAVTVSGSYRVASGDFDGDGRDDLFFYGPGAAPDHVWYGTARRAFASVRVGVNGDYAPLTGDWNGDGVDDVFWYAPGAGADYVWYFTRDRRARSVAVTVNGSYQPAAGDIDGDGATDIVWFSPASLGGDPVWWGRAASTAFVAGTARG